jgi:predicted RNA-binding protein associated with RNAse of E/G family
MPELITVLKRNPAGEVTWQYEGTLLRRGPNVITLEALFNREDTPLMEVVFKRGDRFIETFFSDRWYNVFEVHDRDDGRLKGWYCNIGRPADLKIDSVSYIDLALDLWVAADGTQTVLDEDEFAGLPVDAETRARARTGLQELRSVFSEFCAQRGLGTAFHEYTG